jgi:hypothetical protein
MLRNLRDAAVTTVQSVPRRLRRRLKGVPVQRESLRLVSTAGYQLSAAIWRPVAEGRHPGVLLCPGTCDPGTIFEGWTQPLNARELASNGLTVMIFDPAGRGDSWGEEDYGGPEHQDNVRAALLHLAGLPYVDPDRLGVVAISLGLAMACGALAAYADELPAGWLIDWEGPCDREIITAGGTIMAPAMGHSMKDEVYWRPREAVRHVGKLKCGYLRLQAEVDHAQPGEYRHAERMIRAASEGDLPWFKINDHPRGVVPDQVQWNPAGRGAANRELTRWVKRLSSLA